MGIDFSLRELLMIYESIMVTKGTDRKYVIVKPKAMYKKIINKIELVIYPTIRSQYNNKRIKFNLSSLICINQFTTNEKFRQLIHVSGELTADVEEVCYSKDKTCIGLLVRVIRPNRRIFIPALSTNIGKIKIISKNNSYHQY